MGHYAAEMVHESPKSGALRKKYWSTRKALESLPLSALTVGQLHKALNLLSEERTPSRGFENVFYANELIREMRALISGGKPKKAAKK